MIAAGIEATHVKIPVIVANQEHISFSEIALASRQPARQPLILGEAGLVG